MSKPSHTGVYKIIRSMFVTQCSQICIVCVIRHGWHHFIQKLDYSLFWTVKFVLSSIVKVSFLSQICLICIIRCDRICEKGPFWQIFKKLGLAAIQSATRSALNLVRDYDSARLSRKQALVIP